VEREAARRALDSLRGAAQRPTGKLYAELFPGGSMTRDDFEEVLGALARAGLVRIVSAVFDKDGQSIPYRKAALTTAGEALEDNGKPEFQMKAAVATTTRKRKGRKKAAQRGRSRKGVVAGAAPKPSGTSPVSSTRLEEALRGWRLAEAKRRGVPAFRICTDATLKAIAERRPSSAAELLAIPGIGMKAVENYGATIYRLVAQSGGRA
jgi:superfamily II DNA helicase RecQ